jgi:RNA polymerase sigma factor (sigma-70 family)
MGISDTTLGGSRDAFPETVWSRFVSGTRDVDLDGLFRLYWRPVYAFIRTAARGSVEDAKDLTQEFFGYLMEGDVLAAYRADRGRFRVFLKGVLRNFLAHDRRDRGRLKRGGGKLPFSLDVDGLETDGFLADPRSRTPEELFDRRWADDVLSSALERLKTGLAAEDLRIFEGYYGGGEDYAALAARLDVPRQRVKSCLDSLRDRLTGILRELLSPGVTSYDELAREMKDLLLP